eukprot:6230706-Prymnesium_polylepis.1
MGSQQGGDGENGAFWKSPVLRDLVASNGIHDRRKHTPEPIYRLQVVVSENGRLPLELVSENRSEVSLVNLFGSVDSVVVLEQPPQYDLAIPLRLFASAPALA